MEHGTKTKLRVKREFERLRGNYDVEESVENTIEDLDDDALLAVDFDMDPPVVATGARHIESQEDLIEEFKA